MTLLFAVLLAALAVILAPVTVKVMDRQAGYPLAVLFLIAAVLIAKDFSAIAAGEELSFQATWVRDFIAPGVDVSFALRGDALSIFFAMLALVIGAVVLTYSAAYLPKNEGNTSFYTLMTAFTLSILLLVLANDVVVLFLAWELVSLASFMLIARSGSGGEAGSQRTLILTFIGGLTLLTALGIAAVTTGSTTISEILASSVWDDRPGVTASVAVLIAASAFTKSAQFPFHFWLPEAMAAATPVSAFLHAAAVVKAGIYLLIRFSTVFYDVAVWNWVLIVVGMGTAVMSAVFAVQKTDLKKLTAYSTVSHLGWIVATIGVGTPFAIGAALVHTLAHALFKSSLFMLIGVIDHEAGSRDIRRLGPLWNKMPWTFGSVVIGAASMAAVPPLLGFVSKEGMLTAFEDAPIGGAGQAILLAVAGIGAFFTFTYSAKIVFGAFFDGPRSMDDVHEAPVALWLPAALPGFMSLPLVFVLGIFDEPLEHAVAAVGMETHSHLAVWHGINVPFIISILVLVAGIAGLFARKKMWPAFEGRNFMPRSGNELLQSLQDGCAKLGQVLGKMSDSHNPSRHILPIVIVVIVLAGTTLFGEGVDGVPLQPRVDGLDNPWDLLPLGIIALSVFGLVRTKNRLTGAVMIGIAGTGVTLQMFLLGAPDVALTQFMVEALSVVVMMMVLRYLPETFQPVTDKSRRVGSIVIAVLAGIAAFLGVWGLMGRHERSDLALWYLDEAPDITGGDNVVATIIVEFRALDTLGELSVLGMAAVVIAAITTTLPRFPFSSGTRPAPFGQSQLNSVPLRKGINIVIPLLIIMSVIVFFRGHNSSGGGFPAALIMGAAIGLTYLSRGSDEIVFGRMTPVHLTGIGIITALLAGFIGYWHDGFGNGGFLTALHGEAFGQHWTTSLIFDLGIYLAVLGMLTMAINALGGYLRPGTERDFLPWIHDDDSALPATPRIAVEDADDPYPDPINPSTDPLALLSPKEAKTKTKQRRRSNANRGGEK
ncbi:NADH-ubiquinone/plastoquinone (complex I) family protein [Corynebacterium accolens ATCC 49726]|uniref:DUF4040 family protein n=1 Tax=Corynebacterium accolens TaxID=38284 RepID=UPI0001E17009|nr:DUF4040 family protein [Corynebacterium accolens]EFM43356.1 NADH-ubiquinone/plastoquinone (complex I) family protein [Corynebacterium accolens ATCC 49726]